MNWYKYSIDITKLAGGKGFCPNCHQSRKHKRDRSLSVDLSTGLFNCHNCGFKGCAAVKETLKEYVKPLARLQKIGDKALSWFEKDRGISNNTLLRFKVSESSEWMPQFDQECTVVCFNYFRGDQLVNIKFRGPQKSFRMERDAELIFYNLDSIVGEKTCVIVEGEIDCLTMHECGIYNSVSVPNGASKGSMKLEYLDNCWGFFEDKEKIILCVDNDEAGEALKKELARRLGRNKCAVVHYPEGCKDANEVLLKLGKGAVTELVESATDWPIEGVMTMDQMFPTVDDWYKHGYPIGATCGIAGFDELLTFMPGQLTVVTGIPGHGKDEWCNYVMASLAKNEKWIWGICGFEETPPETVTKLAEKVSGKCFAYRKNPAHRMNETEYNDAIALIDKYFFFINPDEIETDADSLIEKAIELVKRYGIKGFYINPWNWLDHERPDRFSETEYISQVLTKLIKFARHYQVHVFLLAHTTKMVKTPKTGKYEVPNLYSISGSANFFNKTHNGFTVYRDIESKNVDVYVQKVKQSWLGQIGWSTYEYDSMTRQYVFKTSSVIQIEEKNKAQIGLNGNWKPIQIDYTEGDKREIDQGAPF